MDILKLCYYAQILRNYWCFKICLNLEAVFLFFKNSKAKLMSSLNLILQWQFSPQVSSTSSKTGTIISTQHNWFHHNPIKQLKWFCFPGPLQQLSLSKFILYQRIWHQFQRLNLKKRHTSTRHLLLLAQQCRQLPQNGLHQPTHLHSL